MVLVMSSCTLYLDADGDPGWCHPFGRSRVSWYVLAGVVLKPDSGLKARSGIDGVLSRYIPDSEKRKWPPQYYEMCYHDIQRGKKIFTHLDPS